MTAPVALCAIGGTAVILTIVAPYETDRLLRIVPRFGYWLSIIVCTYSAGYFVHALLTPRLPSSNLSATLINGAVTGALVAVIVGLINGTALGFWPNLSQLPVFVGNIFVIAMVVAVIFQVASNHGDTAPVTPAVAVAPALLDRLPFDKRGALWALSVEDHYVHVRTAKGTEMVLLRLRDAMREVGDTAGMQVHRSHWVATDAIASATRNGDGATLTLTDGTDIPVSRRYVAAMKEAGLLPK